MALKHIAAVALLAPVASFAGVTTPSGTLGGIEGSVPATSFFASSSVSPSAVGQLASLTALSPGNLQAFVAIAQSNGMAGALANAASAILSSPAAISAFANLAGISQSEATAILTALSGSAGGIDGEDS